MEITLKIVLFFLIFAVLLVQPAYALSFTGFTDKFNYKINDTMNYTGSSDQNITSNITLWLINTSHTVFNTTSLIPNATNFTTQLSASVPRSGEYFIKANFTFNSTYYESSAIVKISKAHTTVISTNKPAYSPGEKINFTVLVTDVNSIGISDENMTVRLLYGTNDTVLAITSGLTNSAGEMKSSFTAPSTIGSYRLTVNDWIATKIVDISTFDLVAYSGDSTGNLKTRFGANENVFIYMDLFDSNKTRYQGTETISVQVTLPNGTQNASVSYAFSGSRINTSFNVTDKGIYTAKVTVVSNSKSLTLPIEVGKYELVGWLEKNTTQSNVFFPNETVNIRVKVFNVSSGEVIKTAALDEVFDLILLDANFANFSTISNSSSLDPVTGVRSFSFNASSTSGLYYVRIRLNQTIDLDMKVAATVATAIPVDQNKNFKNYFVGNQQTIRVLTTLSNFTSQVNVTNVSAVSVKTRAGADITSSLKFNTSIVEYRDAKAGLVEFSAPTDAGPYFVKTLTNNNFAAEAQFLVKFYTACAQLEGYKWFVGANEDVNLTVRVAEAKDVGVVDSLSGNSSDSTNTAGNFSSLYGMYDCYAAYTTTASGSSSAGNNTANIRVSVAKIINTLNGEDVTTKVANLPNNNTDDNGRLTLTMTRPSGGWDSGTYVVEMELKDKNNNTDKGFGTFQVRSLWVSIWPKQIDGRWKWYFSPTENMSFEVNAYNSTGTWYYYGTNSGVGDNCYVLDVFYQGNGAEWFSPPKTVSTGKYSWSCTNSSVPTNGRFNLNITPTSAFDTGYYMVRVKVNTTNGTGDSGEGWYSVKAYNVYVRTKTLNYYDSWYRTAAENISLTVDVTYANSTRWECYWQKCPTSELVTDNMNFTVKVIRYESGYKDYAKSKYNVTFTNVTTATSTNALVTRFVNISTAAANASTANSNSSISITLPKNATVNYAFVAANVTNTSLNLTGNVSLVDQGNSSANFGTIFNTTNFNATAANISFTTQLRTALETCVNSSGNCTLGFNVSLNSSTNVTFSGLILIYNATPHQPAETTSLQSVNTTSGSVNVTLIPRGGTNGSTWESGYYSVAVTAEGPQGKEISNYWFEIRKFFVNLQPVKSNSTNTSVYSYASSDNITINVSATNKPSWMSGSSYNVTISNIAANITSMKLSYWDPTIYQMRETPVTWATSAINGQTPVNITPSSTLSPGNYYNLEVTLNDSDGNNQTGWTSFQIKDYTFAARTSNWRWEFNNTENITLNVAVCTGDTWWCDFNTNTYSGATVNVSVTKLMKTNTYPYTAVGGWAANTTQLTSAGSGKGNLTIVQTSSLAGGYYSAELQSKYASGSGTPVTSNVWFKIESFKMSVSVPKWETKMGDNVSLVVTTTAAATISDGQVTCGYWPDQTVYSFSASSLSPNVTSINPGTTGLMLYPTGGANWVSGYCYGYVTLRSGDESQSAYFSVRLTAFALQVTQTKYYYLKNESVILKISSDQTQAFNISDINITTYNYETGSSNVLRITQDFTNSNVTNKVAFRGNATLNITPVGNWSFKGWHNGRFDAVDSNNSAIKETGWFYFDVRDLFYGYGWTVSPGTTNYYGNYNTSSVNLTMLVYVYKYNTNSVNNWWPYTAASGVNITITSIEKQSCISWPCTYSNVTGWTAATATTKSDGTAMLNMTRTGGWSGGWHYTNVRFVENSTGETSTQNKQMGFWIGG